MWSLVTPEPSGGAVATRVSGTGRRSNGAERSGPGRAARRKTSNAQSAVPWGHDAGVRTRVVGRLDGNADSLAGTK